MHLELENLKHVDKQKQLCCDMCEPQKPLTPLFVTKYTRINTGLLTTQPTSRVFRRTKAAKSYTVF